MKRTVINISFIEAGSKARKLGLLGRGLLGLDRRDEEILLNRYEETTGIKINRNSVTRDYIMEAAMAKACEYIAWEDYGVEGPYRVAVDLFNGMIRIEGNNGTGRV